MNQLSVGALLIGVNIRYFPGRVIRDEGSNLLLRPGRGQESSQSVKAKWPKYPNHKSKLVIHLNIFNF